MVGGLDVGSSGSILTEVVPGEPERGRWMELFAGCPVHAAADSATARQATPAPFHRLMPESSHGAPTGLCRYFAPWPTARK